MGMEPGHCIEMCGPLGDVTIDWPTFTVFKAQIPMKFSKLVLIAAGSGVTPMIQILQDWILRGRGNGANPVHIELLYSCRFEKDIAFHKELKQLANKFSSFFKFLLAVSQPEDP